MNKREIYFGEYGTAERWDLVLASKGIGEAEPKEEYVDIPSGNGSIDLTEALTGEIVYDDRDLDFAFTICHPREEWEALLRDIKSKIHGRRMVIREPDDLGHYYIGRVKVDSVLPNRTIATLKVSAVCEPYKLKNNVTVKQGTIGASGSMIMTCENDRKRVIPTITTSAAINISFEGNSISVNAGTFRMTNLVFVEGLNTMTITGAAGTVVEFEYQEGAL